MNESSTTEFMTVADAPALAALSKRPGLTLLYLHDPWCSISSRAFHQLDALGGIVELIDVDANPELGRIVEEMTGVRHESPQAILLRDGEPVWAASHFAITTDGARRALAQTSSA